MIPRRLTDRVTILNAALVTGPRGQQIRDWASAAQTFDVPARVEPVAGVEDTDARQTVIERWRLTTLPTVTLTPTSRVVYVGGTLEVDGDVAVSTYQGRPYAKVTTLKRVTDG